MFQTVIPSGNNSHPEMKETASALSQSIQQTCPCVNTTRTIAAATEKGRGDKREVVAEGSVVHRRRAVAKAQSLVYELDCEIGHNNTDSGTP